MIGGLGICYLPKQDRLHVVACLWENLISAVLIPSVTYVTPILMESVMTVTTVVTATVVTATVVTATVVTATVVTATMTPMTAIVAVAATKVAMAATMPDVADEMTCGTANFLECLCSGVTFPSLVHHGQALSDCLLKSIALLCAESLQVARFLAQRFQDLGLTSQACGADG